MLCVSIEVHGMPSFTRHVATVLALLFASSMSSGCIYYIPICDEVRLSYSDFLGPFPGQLHYEQPANSWVESPGAANYLRRLIEEKGRRMLDRQDYECSPQAVPDCADCLQCTRTIRNVRSKKCKREGDLFIRAYVGPGSNVQAQTYWRK